MGQQSQQSGVLLVRKYIFKFCSHLWLPQEPLQGAFLCYPFGGWPNLFARILQHLQHWSG